MKYLSLKRLLLSTQQHWLKRGGNNFFSFLGLDLIASDGRTETGTTSPCFKLVYYPTPFTRWGNTNLTKAK